ncbi:MAG TPA: hypothetical protein VHJ18_16070 [Streptosporangiaceae bacterium]|jgi:hypothetical protein|nr:hypothetical protein [Streptosporangiaceae bacterium]
MQPKHMLVVAAGALIAFALGLGLGLGIGSGRGQAISPAPGHSRSAAAASGRPLCSANPCRITMTHNGSAGLVVQDARGPKVENAFIIIDPSGLPEFWQNATGAYEGPRGEICATNSFLAPVACLGGDGTTGWIRIGSEILTSGDLAWMHSAEGATRPAAYGPGGPVTAWPASLPAARLPGERRPG